MKISSGLFGVPGTRPKVQTRHRRNEVIMHRIGQLRLSCQSPREFKEDWVTQVYQPNRQKIQDKLETLFHRQDHCSR
ncbi:MAG: hypothetical protein ABSH11_14850, partial [Verrucomicrobiota bacterium]